MEDFRGNTLLNHMAPKPVHPRAVRFHGLFGIPFLRSHMITDSRWTASSLTENYKGMTEMLEKRLTFKKLEFVEDQKKALREYRSLRAQCRSGRQHLQSLQRSNFKRIRHFFNKDMLRLYQNMPNHLIFANIDQRTFALRKEYDRLRYRINQLKNCYHNQLLERAEIKNRIKYQNEFVLEEEIKSQKFRKKIENSAVRLKAIKTINVTYKRMIHILRHDSNFYEPILRSLTTDIENQEQFIQHVTYMGTPAISKLKELRERFRKLEENTRKSLQNKLQYIGFLKKDEEYSSKAQSKPQGTELLALHKRYVRESNSMCALKCELETIESTIKQIKIVTLCSQARDIYPRMKSQAENNEKLRKKIARDELTHETLGAKQERANVLHNMLTHTQTPARKSQLVTLKSLKERLLREDKTNREKMNVMRNQSDAFVLLRYSLWNLNEMLRHVNRSKKPSSISYPVDYLQLPLLKFDMMTIRACPPEQYEQNIDELMRIVKGKVQKLMSAYTTEASRGQIASSHEEYHREFLASLDIFDKATESENAEDEDCLQEAKTMHSVPNRKQIKAMSAKIVEAHAKKDEL